ncbi:HNH endonuclease [Frankia saprophytica]|uniref:HNH endonuclease n=1 Tax=Pseudofrankia saprophytica TaxID=298655 RepID=UPI0012FEA6CD
MAGEISGTGPDGKPDWHVREVLIAQRGQRCEQCGWAELNPTSGRVPLHVDHISGDRARNRPEDLRLLCPNCHSLTPTYQHLNNKNVSPIRRKAGRRYRETWLSSAS